MLLLIERRGKSRMELSLEGTQDAPEPPRVGAHPKQF